MRKILIPLDGSPFSEEALVRGLRQYSPEETKLVLFHCIDLNKLVARLGHIPAKIYVDTETEKSREREEYLDNLARKLEEQGYSTKSVVAIGDPVERILALSREESIDIIVMTTHARTGLERLFVGSVTEGVIRRADCLVLAVPPRQELQPGN